MAARKRSGLGQSLSDIAAETAAQDAAAGPQVPNPGDPIRKVRRGIGALISSGDDFGPYFLDEADEYFQGPGRSTRVRAHQFVPTSPVPTTREERLGVLNRDQFKDTNIEGWIYVRFWKKNTLVRYGPCTLADYRRFMDSASKGRSVNSLQMEFGFEYASKDPGVEI